MTTHRTEYSGQPSREAYQSLADASGLPLSEIVGMAEQNRLHAAVLRAEARSAKRKRVTDYQQKILHLRAKRNGPAPGTPACPEACPTCGTSGFDVGLVCGICGLVWDTPFPAT